MNALEKRVRRHVRAPEHEFFAAYPPGFADIAAQEAARLGVAAEVSPEGVCFSGKLETLYRSFGALRGASRIMMRLARFRAENFRELVRRTKEVPWELYLPQGCSREYRVSCSRSRLYHSDAVAERVEEAVGGAMGSGTGAVQRIMVRLEDDVCTLSLDASGDALYKRGWKTMINDAPVRETIAAMLLEDALLYGAESVIDPLCGSGTFTLEALSLCGQVPLYHPSRRFACREWPVFSAGSFAHALASVLPPYPGITDFFCNDAESDARSATAANLAGLPAHGARVTLTDSDFFALPRPASAGGRALVIMNPPYGRRIDADGDLYARIARTLAERYPDDIWSVLVPEGITFPAGEVRRTFRNGGIAVRNHLRLPR